MSTACCDCGMQTLSVEPDERAEWYMVTPAVWAGAGMGRGCLCVGCLEARLGRRLVAADFSDVPVNDLGHADNPRYAWSFRTPRLVDRMSTRN